LTPASTMPATSPTGRSPSCRMDAVEDRVFGVEAVESALVSLRNLPDHPPHLVRQTPEPHHVNNDPRKTAASDPPPAPASIPP
jgi:hypothetical protein